MGPLCRGGVLVPPHTKGALGIAAVPNQGRSLLPGRGSSALKPRGGIPSTGAWCYIQLGERVAVPRQGAALGWGPWRAQGIPAGSLPRLCAPPRGCPRPPPQGHAAPPRTECLEALCDPVTRHTPSLAFTSSLCHLLPIPVTLPAVSFLLRLPPCDSRSDISPVSSYRVS